MSDGHTVTLFHCLSSCIVYQCHTFVYISTDLRNAVAAVVISQIHITLAIGQLTFRCFCDDAEEVAVWSAFLSRDGNRTEPKPMQWGFFPISNLSCYKLCLSLDRCMFWRVQIFRELFSPVSLFFQADCAFLFFKCKQLLKIDGYTLHNAVFISLPVSIRRNILYKFVVCSVGLVYSACVWVRTCSARTLRWGSLCKLSWRTMCVHPCVCFSKSLTLYVCVC